MTDHQEQERPELTIHLTIGFDKFGEPLINMQFTAPEDNGVGVDQVEEIAIHMLTTVAAARANATIARKMMLDGCPPQEAIQFLQSIMGA